MEEIQEEITLKGKHTWAILVIWLLYTGCFFSMCTESGNCGKIAFISDRESKPQLFVIDADGSNLAQIAADYSYNVEPCWSPDGTRILFASDRRGDYNIYAMDPDGSNVGQLTDDRERDRAPAWSPDGKRIAFAGYNDIRRQICSMDPDGNNPIRLRRVDHILSASSMMEIYPQKEQGDASEILQGISQRLKLLQCSSTSIK